MPLAKRLGRVIYCANPRQISRRATPSRSPSGPAAGGTLARRTHPGNW
ncbi:TPA: hypothetical protein L5597_005556 [Pseudomonas aeruginosa]|nr:hypothetical protein [Pseudomonas aeruginosa]HBP4698035.1 hypothetical protein [Pseudomonas aeruginosa]